MKSGIGDTERLRHMRDAIEEVERYTAAVSFDGFQANSMMLFASIKQLEIIGEAANNLSNSTKALFPDIDWRQIIGMRHILIHEYFGVDASLVWQVIEKDLPDLKRAISGGLPL